jgi:hypothetical protein
MAVKLEEVCRLLDEAGIKYRARDESAVVMTWTTKRYLNPEGKNSVFLVVQLVEDGAYLRVFMPQAFRAEGPHVDALFRACMMIQWHTKLVQFEYDDEDGEIRPLVEFPLEDAKVTRRQLERCVRSLVYLIDTFYPTLRKAHEEGVIELPEPSGPSPPRASASIAVALEAAQELVASLKEDGLAEDDKKLVSARRVVEALERAGGRPAEGPPSEV